jgi:mannose-1-phosphate guanylyltransferase
VKALLLAAGLGTRLRPLTESVPKCLVPIKNIPLLKIWLEKLKEVGVADILINTHYLVNKVEEFLIKEGYEGQVNLVYESKLLGTAGTFLKNINFFCGDDDAIVIHADNYCSEKLTFLIKAHESRPKNCLMTMLVFETENPSECGIVRLDQNQIITEIHEKKKTPPGNLANGAIYIFTPKAINIIMEECNSAIDMVLDVLPNFLGKIYSYKTEGIFLDIGTLKNYQKANE